MIDRITYINQVGLNSPRFLVLSGTPMGNCVSNLDTSRAIFQSQPGKHQHFVAATDHLDSVIKQSVSNSCEAGRDDLNEATKELAKLLIPMTIDRRSGISPILDNNAMASRYD